MNRAFSKIWIVVIIVVLIAGGISAWQYFGALREEGKAPEEKVAEEKASEEAVSEEKTTQIKLYFNDNKSVKEGGCKSTASVVRTISEIKETEKMVEIALDELLKGPTQEEKEQGYYFLAHLPKRAKDRIEARRNYLKGEMLNPAVYEDLVKLKSLEIKDGIAYVDFNLVLYALCITNEKGDCLYMDSCEDTSLRTAISNTLKQFPEIRDVVITVEGEKYPCLDTDCFKRLEFELGKSDVFIEAAGMGEGITHLARRALDKYLKQVSHAEKIKLTEEQKVYIEDYLQNKIGSEFLKIGESREFSAELIKDAIFNSQNLSLFAQQGLSEYILFSPTSIESGVIPDKEEDSMTIWFRYLKPNNNLITDAEVSLMLISPEEHKYGVHFSKINNYYYTTLYYASMFKGSYCFQVKASKGNYEPQEKNLGCLNLSEYETNFRLSEDETADWKTYSNPEVDFTFKYPPDWEIIEDYFYETAAGIKAEQRTVTLQRVGDSDSNNWIRINPRQFQTEVGKCIGSICTYSKNTEILNIFDKVVKSFKNLIIEIDIPTGWKIYRNKEYGFEIKYPNKKEERTRFIEKPYLYAVAFDIPCIGKDEETGEIQQMGETILEIEIAENLSNLSVKDWLETYIKPEYYKHEACEEDWENIQFKEYSFAGEKGLKADFVRRPCFAPGCSPKIYIAKHSKIYIIGVCIYDAWSGPCTLQPNPEEMLSTFRFLE